MQRAEIKQILQHSTARVIFTKKDGSERVMKCTLREEVLPELKGSNAARSQEVLPVWDLEAEGWRSFRIDSIKSVEVVE